MQNITKKLTLSAAFVAVITVVLAVTGGIMIRNFSVQLTEQRLLSKTPIFTSKQVQKIHELQYEIEVAEKNVLLAETKFKSTEIQHIRNAANKEQVWKLKFLGSKTILMMLVLPFSLCIALVFVGIGTFVKLTTFEIRDGEMSVPCTWRQVTMLHGFVNAHGIAKIESAHSGREREVLEGVQKMFEVHGGFLAKVLNLTKYSGQVPTAPMLAENIECSDIAADSSPCSLMELLKHPDLQEGNVPWGLTIDGHELIQESLAGSQGILLVGAPGFGKSHLAKIPIVCALYLYEQGFRIEGSLFDPHFNAPQALSTFFKPILSHPFFKERVLGSKAFTEGKHIDALERLLAEKESRESSGQVEPYKLIVYDELFETCAASPYAKKYGDLTAQKLIESLNARKFGYLTMICSTDFTKAAVHTTSIGALGVTGIAVNGTPSKAEAVLGKEDAKMVHDLPAGQAVFKFRGRHPIIGYAPSVTQDVLAPFLNMQATKDMFGEEAHIIQGATKGLFETENPSREEPIIDIPVMGPDPSLVEAKKVERTQGTPLLNFESIVSMCKLLKEEKDWSWKDIEEKILGGMSSETRKARFRDSSSSGYRVWQKSEIVEASENLRKYVS